MRVRGKAVVLNDEDINFQLRAIKHKAIATIAMRQPVAVDLREVIGILRISNDLERIGDLAKNIGKRVLVLDHKNVPRRALRSVVDMARLAVDLFNQTLESYARRDGNKAMKA